MNLISGVNFKMLGNTEKESLSRFTFIQKAKVNLEPIYENILKFRRNSMTQTSRETLPKLNLIKNNS